MRLDSGFSCLKRKRNLLALPSVGLYSAARRRWLALNLAGQQGESHSDFVCFAVKTVRGGQKNTARGSIVIHLAHLASLVVAH